MADCYWVPDEDGLRCSRCGVKLPSRDTTIRRNCRMVSVGDVVQRTAAMLGFKMCDECAKRKAVLDRLDGKVRRLWGGEA
jgi:hypothetical protein